jgi:hypothetical protein
MNGAKFADLQTADLNLDYRAKAVDSMTEDEFNVGYVKGNMQIDLNFEIAIQNALSTPKAESIDFTNNSVQITWICGQDQWVVTGVFIKTAKNAASGVGTEAKKSWTFGGLKCLDSVGNSVLFPLSLSLAA